MPTYEYVCTACAHAWEELQKITEPALEVCPSCADKTAKRQISAGNFILKGGGWYADLYSSSKPAAKDAPKDEAKTETKAEAKTEAKTETKTETKTESKAPAASTSTSSAPSGGADKK